MVRVTEWHVKEAVRDLDFFIEYLEHIEKRVELSRTRGKERETAYEEMLELANACVEDNAVMTYLLYLICRNQARGQER